MNNPLRRWARGLFARQGRGQRLPQVRPLLEALEDRFAPAVFNVNTLQDLSLSPGVNPNGTIKGTNTITLRSAIQAANGTPGGNTINLTLPGTYLISLAPTTPNESDNLAGEFAILPEGNLTINNTSHGAVTVRGGGQSRVFDINPDDTTNPATHFLVTMQGFTITGGRAFDATGATPDGPVATGGGIRVQGNQSLTLTNMVLTRNTATADGGGVVMENTVNSDWKLTLNATTVSNNHAGDAGGGIDTDGAGKVVINTGSVISGNTDLNQGGGIYVDSIQVGAVFISASMTMTGTIVNNNQALAAGTLGPPASGGSGGGISNAGNGAMIINNSTIENNFAAGVGGGFSDENAQGTLTVNNSVFSGNTSNGDGGGIQEGGPRLTINHSSFDNNSSGASGGAIFANGTTLTIRGSTFDGNSSISNGGAIEVETTGSGEHASFIVNSTITGNSALSNVGGVNGGGIDAANGFAGTLVLLNDTINANFADNGGGVFVAGMAGSVVRVQNTIIAQNTATASGPDVNGTFTDNGGNLIGTTSSSTGFTAGTTQVGVDPLLGPLQYNGGPIIGAPGATEPLMTEALQSGSPAINKGVLAGSPTTDERGDPRPDPGTNELPDIGAFEVQDG
jgi:predicted outer membrane repeat protein